MQKWLYVFIAVLLLPALLVNLGEMVLIDDEGIRALVAQEMMWTGNFIAPTLHGDAYLNKPPLWNWILALNFWGWGTISEWTVRFPTIVALLGFAFTTYRFSREILGKQLAVIHALTVITCGRMLFWDSMLALIDVCFSWVVYSQIMLLYHYGKKRQWWRAFGWAYLLCTIGFLLKGLPAIAFTGITIIALLWWTKSWIAFIKPAHILSGLACLLLLGLYYWQLSHYIDLQLIADRLFEESEKRTATNFSLWDNLQNFVSFPIEMLYHFLPWTLLVIYFFQRGAWKKLQQNDAAAFMLVAFLANIPIYWFSPNVYPRYLLMLFPLLFGAGLYLHGLHEVKNSIHFRMLHYFLLFIMAGFSLGFLMAPLFSATEIVPFRWWWAIGFGVVGLGLTQMQWARTQPSLLSFCAFLLLTRLAFNIFVLPPRALSDEKGQELRRSAQLLGKKYRAQQNLLVFGHTLMEPAVSFYLENAYGGIVYRSFGPFNDQSRYILNEWQYQKTEGQSVDRLFNRHQPDSPYYPVLQLDDPPQASSKYAPPLLDGMGTGVMIHKGVGKD